MVCRLVIYSGIISSNLYTYISSDRININARDRICTYTFSIRSLHIFLYRDRISDLYSYILSDRINIWYRDQFWMLCRIVHPRIILWYWNHIHKVFNISNIQGHFLNPHDELISKCPYMLHLVKNWLSNWRLMRRPKFLNQQSLLATSVDGSSST